jgi:hypothetical protein
MRSRKIAVFAFSLMMFFSSLSTYAQCAMCKSTATSDHEGGNTTAEGLNNGILYLMAIPYLILMLGAYFFFKKQVDAKLLSWKAKFFPSKSKLSS